MCIRDSSYGIGVSRLVGAIIEAKYDDKNEIMKWPLSVAPYDIALIPMINKNDTTALEKANNINSELIKNDMQNNPIIFAKKGSGMLRGFQLNEDVTAGDFSNIAREKSLLLVGAAENTIRLLPPLNTSKEEVDNAFDILNDIVLELKKT